MDKWRIYCETDGWLDVIADHEPTECPIDGGHVLRDLSAIVETDIQTNPTGLPTDVSLENYKLLKNNLIDQRTSELINAGHEFPPASGQIFSMSQNAQLNVLGLMESKDVISYPQPYATKDNKTIIDLNNATDVTNFYYNVLNHKKTQLDSGNVLIAQVNAATDEAGVDAVVDNR
jgi:hypothetical protein